MTESDPEVDGRIEHIERIAAVVRVLEAGRTETLHLLIELPAAAQTLDLLIDVLERGATPATCSSVRKEQAK